MFAAFKGWLGEKAAQVGMWLWLDSKIYRRMHDIVLPSGTGTTQIDHVIVSVHGVFVVETKNMKGWIFGDERSSHWTQTLFRKKSRFQNPIHQNYRHVMALTEFLGVRENVLRPLVFFFGDCEIKTPMPENVLTRGLCSYIKSFKDHVLTPGQVDDICVRLAAAKSRPIASHSIHVDGLRKRFDGTACPKCGSALVLRTAKRGKSVGSQFLGCSRYPNCRYTRAN